MKTFPTLTPAQPDETPEQFGVRAFSFLAVERVPVGCISPDARAAALHFSILLVTAPDLLDTTREQWQDVRRQLAQRAADDQRALATAPAPVAPQQPAAAPQGGGSKVVRPTAPTRPTPPSTGASLITGNPLPSPAEALARIDAIKQRVRASLPAIAAAAQQEDRL
ncbi:MAG TPA: hypothetical protein VN903_17240 [Polyangia bacterium]|nr:hypothetical protein [Polyangia bacterium]